MTLLLTTDVHVLLCDPITFTGRSYSHTFSYGLYMTVPAALGNHSPLLQLFSTQIINDDNM